MPLSKARDRQRKQEARLESIEFQPRVIPFYNPMIHKAGDTVRVKQGKRESIVVIPLIDADGNSYD